MYNKVILIGRVAVEPELRYTPSGKPVADFVLAVDRPKFGDTQEKTADFVKIVVWQKLAEICANYLTKGKLIAIDGRLQVSSYETADGQKRKAYEVVASTMKMLDRPKTSTPVAEEVNSSGSTAKTSEPVEIPSEEFAMEEVPF